MAISELIGSAPEYRKVLEEISLVAPAGCAVLVEGERGLERKWSPARSMKPAHGGRVHSSRLIAPQFQPH